ncbi:hypothetical protein AB0E69_03730 [Kribbella sp. NPDC026611]|uniref:hypothetical protein n=1 Tax=Kribbella sp. NPDC026611 TaxID=3154911 RepID=UPI0033C58F67
MPEHDPEQELGPRISSALQSQADAQTGLQKGGLAGEARRRVRKRRQLLTTAASVVLVAGVIGGVWNLSGGGGAETASTSSGGAGDSKALAPQSTEGMTKPKAAEMCPSTSPILQEAGPGALSAGLDVNTPVTGMQACRYSRTAGLIGQQQFGADLAQQVVNEIKVLPERNPELPVFKCAPQTAQPSEAIVLRFTTAAGPREIWVEYDGCQWAGFYTGTHTYGLYAAPLKLFLVGTVRPTGGTYLSALQGW